MKMPSGPRTRLRWTADRPPACESANRRQVPAPCRAPHRLPAPIKPPQKRKGYPLGPCAPGTTAGHRGHRDGGPATQGARRLGASHTRPPDPARCPPGGSAPVWTLWGQRRSQNEDISVPGQQLSPEMDGDYPTRRQACCRDAGTAQIPAPHPRPARATHPGDMGPVCPGDALPPAPTQAGLGPEASGGAESLGLHEGGPRRTPWRRPGLQTLVPNPQGGRTASTCAGLTLASFPCPPALSGLVTALACFSVPWARDTGRDRRPGFVSQPPRSQPCSLALDPGVVPTHCSMGHSPLCRVRRDLEGVRPAATGSVSGRTRDGRIRGPTCVRVHGRGASGVSGGSPLRGAGGGDSRSQPRVSEPAPLCGLQWATLPQGADVHTNWRPGPSWACSGWRPGD